MKQLGTVKPLCALVLLVGLITAACGGDDDTSNTATAEPSTPTTAAGGSGNSGGGGSGGSAGGGAAAANTPIGPVAANTIQIGDTTWTRTLPMTTGQCFLQESESLGNSAVGWGPLDGDHSIRFSANQNQDGTFEAEVRDDERIFWIAGPRSPGVDDLEIELDFNALTIVGEGTFSTILGDSAPGSFHFECLPEDQ